MPRSTGRVPRCRRAAARSDLRARARAPHPRSRRHRAARRARTPPRADCRSAARARAGPAGCREPAWSPIRRKTGTRTTPRSTETAQDRTRAAPHRTPLPGRSRPESPRPARAARATSRAGSRTARLLRRTTTPPRDRRSASDSAAGARARRKSRGNRAAGATRASPRAAMIARNNGSPARNGAAARSRHRASRGCREPALPAGSTAATGPLVSTPRAVAAQARIIQRRDAAGTLALREQKSRERPAHVQGQTHVQGQELSQDHKQQHAGERGGRP